MSRGRRGWVAGLLDGWEIEDMHLNSKSLCGSWILSHACATLQSCRHARRLAGSGSRSMAPHQRQRTATLSCVMRRFCNFVTRCPQPANAELHKVSPSLCHRLPATPHISLAPMRPQPIGSLPVQMDSWIMADYRGDKDLERFEASNFSVVEKTHAQHLLDAVSTGQRRSALGVRV